MTGEGDGWQRDCPGLGSGRFTGWCRREVDRPCDRASYGQAARLSSVLFSINASHNRLVLRVALRGEPLAGTLILSLVQASRLYLRCPLWCNLPGPKGYPKTSGRLAGSSGVETKAQ